MFVDWPGATRREVFDLASTAYRQRSAVVHGGVLGKQLSGSIVQFVDAFEELMRLAIRKSLREGTDVPDFGSREYWLRLLLPPTVL